MDGRYEWGLSVVTDHCGLEGIDRTMACFTQCWATRWRLRLCCSPARTMDTGQRWWPTPFYTPREVMSASTRRGRSHSIPTLSVEDLRRHRGIPRAESILSKDLRWSYWIHMSRAWYVPPIRLRSHRTSKSRRAGRPTLDIDLEGRAHLPNPGTDWKPGSGLWMRLPYLPFVTRH